MAKNDNSDIAQPVEQVTTAASPLFGNMLMIPALGVMIPTSALLGASFDMYSEATSELVTYNDYDFPKVAESHSFTMTAYLILNSKSVDYVRLENNGIKVDHEDDEVDEDDEAPVSVLVLANGALIVTLKNVATAESASQTVPLKDSAAFKAVSSKSEKNEIALAKNLDVYAKLLAHLNSEGPSVMDDLDAGDSALDAVNGGGTAQQAFDEEVEEIKEKLDSRIEFFTTQVIKPFNAKNEAKKVGILEYQDLYYQLVGEAYNNAIVSVD
jgi:hypothetical protein